jgi:5'-3' exonuclease
MTNVVFCIDCSYKDIWRNSLTTDYKATRPESLKKKGFNAFNVFAYMKKDYLPELQVQYGVKILYHPKCEADDIIGRLAPYLISRDFPMVYVIANDNDYLQICNAQVKMIKGNISQGEVASDNDVSRVGEKYLIRKILLGDISDNIRACNINKLLLEKNNQNLKEWDSILEDKVYKTVTKVNIEILLKDDEGYSFFSQLLDAIRKGDIKDATDPRLVLIRNFYENTVLMDFKMIPQELQKQLEARFASYM